MKKDAITLKNFGIGLATIVGLPIWFPIFALLAFSGLLCAIGEAVLQFFNDD